MEVTEISVKDIFSDIDFNCRGSIAPIDVVDLARDIEKNGLLEPIIAIPVSTNGDNTRAKKFKFQVVAGHRRLMAFKVLKLETIPAVIRDDITHKQALLINLTENIQRKDLNILQEAKALERLRDEGFTIDQVAPSLGKSTTWVRMRFELLALPIEIQAAASVGLITQQQIRELFRINNPDRQIEMVKKIKMAKQRGEKVPVLYKPPKRNIFRPKIRDRNGIFIMQGHIQKIIGNNFGTRCLAWSVGEINDLEIFRDIKEIAAKAGIPYEIPDERTPL